jgi:hypothetical protein
VQTDADRKAAEAIITGGGITSVDQFNQHTNMVLNRSALAEKQHKFGVDQIYKNQKRGNFDWNEFEGTLPGDAPGLRPRTSARTCTARTAWVNPRRHFTGYQRLKGAVKLFFRNGAWVPQ